jgi:hypothetical protein
MGITPLDSVVTILVPEKQEKPPIGAAVAPGRKVDVGVVGVASGMLVGVVGVVGLVSAGARVVGVVGVVSGGVVGVDGVLPGLVVGVVGFVGFEPPPATLVQFPPSHSSPSQFACPSLQTRSVVHLSCPLIAG